MGSIPVETTPFASVYIQALAFLLQGARKGGSFLAEDG